ncbi:Bug family tripartite tricarboxylate transporter substrate binding protein [Bordetella sp. 02P26C-1]|uniref:Bug family tripartite tricarboxylate transporter substrate binding protein n=1 Tax=Bordetella sp. 02P26C-1 TaxID=2683195 RepID=UPI0013544AC6|nr:tripartite tricarboxylate transporter substrate binding protein [Bordetella sp. 02P26C-1]MVW78623.1 tripartite tricarboxylate transporter substrate binding protein [Bordetella sp. 02P26C-1]
MKLAKKTLRATLTAALCATGLSFAAVAQAQAQNYPAKPINLIVPFPAGGTTDVLARALGQELSKTLGQSVIVENKPGAGATLGADYVAKATPDGYTLLMGAVHHTIASSVYPNLQYDFQKSFVPVTTVALVPNILVVNPKVPAQDVQALLDLARKSPGKLTFGSNGVGTGQHLIGAQFQALGDATLLHVPYKGSGPLTTDLLGGQIDMSFDTITPVLPHVKSGKLRALAVTTDQRSAALPDVPTLQEAGLKGFNMGTWFGLLAPAGTPPDVVSKLNTELVKILKSPEFGQRMAEIGAVPIGDSSAEMAQRIKTDTDTYAKLVKEANVKVN